VELALARTAPIFAAKAEPKSKDALLTNARFVWFIAILLSILHAAIAITASLEKSPTFDEPTHLAAGYSYWLRNDFRLDPENGNLIARWAALPLLITHPNFPSPSNVAWQHSDIGTVSTQFFYRSGNNPDAILVQARAMTAIISAALCLLIFFCSHQLFGTLGGLISEALAVLDPNLLAHGALVTSDTAAAFFFLAATWSYWRMLHKISGTTVTICALSVAGLFLAKMSAPLFLIMAAIGTAVWIASSEPMAIRFGQFNRLIVTRWRKAGAIAGSTIAIGLVVFVAIWAAFSFRFSAVTDNGPSRKVWDNCWSAILWDHTAIQNTIDFARVHRLLPEAYLCGFAYTHKSAESRPAFLDGNWNNSGFRSFFPRAFFYKTPLPILFFILLAAAAALFHWHQARSGNRLKIVANDLLRLCPILTLAVIYGAIAISTKLNIGHRHLLPIYPAIFVACGACAYFLRTQNRKEIAIMIAGLIAWQTGIAFASYPNYLAYFNEIAGGPANGYKHLVDSSLDWGQDLPALSNWLNAHENDNETVYLSYFGTGNPIWYGIKANTLPADSTDRAMIDLRPGTYCISATILQSVYAGAQGKWKKEYETVYQAGMERMRNSQTLAPKQQTELRRGLENLRFARLCAYLRHRQPIATAGHSILVFQLSGDDLRAAFDGPPPE
jgi:hypothetical protein